MPRPVSDVKFHVYSRPNTSIWWVWAWRERPDGSRYRHPISTAKFITGPLSRAEYTQDQAQKLVNDATGTKTPSPSAGYLTVDWAMEYMEDRLSAEGKSQKTREIYRCALKTVKSIYGGSYRLTSFTSQHTYDFLRSILALGKNPVTANTYCRVLSSTFNRLHRSGIVEKNPLDRFERLGEPDKKKCLTREELNRFLDQVDNIYNRDAARLIYILAYTGIRRSEVLNIARSDVDLPGNRFMATNNKSRRERKRWLVIPPAVRGHFAYFLEHDGDFPFRRVSPTRLSVIARECMDKAGLPLHLHSLRHSFVTLLLQSGMSPRHAQRLMDHSKLSTTEIYSHDALDTYEFPDIVIRKK